VNESFNANGYNCGTGIGSGLANDSGASIVDSISIQNRGLKGIESYGAGIR
jgi:hypothetical protein